MAARDERSTNLEDILAEEEVDYESDTVVQQEEEEDPQPLQHGVYGHMHLIRSHSVVQWLHHLLLRHYVTRRVLIVVS